MARTPEPKPEKTQRERFIETAREAEADESGERFEKAFDKIARAKPVKGKAKGKS